MSEKDLEKFIAKVKDLQEMIKSLDEIQGRKKALANCSNHDEVVELAKLWGYQIGQRWGELDKG